MGFEGIIAVIVLIAIGRWIVRSVLQSGDESPGASPSPKVPRPVVRTTSARPASSGHTDPRHQIAARDAAKRDLANRDRPGQSAQRRAPSFTPQAADEWYIVLDVPRDAPRSEIMAAVKLRMDRARESGDPGAATRIMRAARDGLGGDGANALARKLRLRNP